MSDRESALELTWMNAARGDPAFFIRLIETPDLREVLLARLDRAEARKLQAPEAPDDASTLQGLLFAKLDIVGPQEGVFILTRDAFLDELRAAADGARTFDEAYDEILASARRLPEYIRRLQEDMDVVDEEPASVSIEERMQQVGERLAATPTGERVMKVASSRTARVAGRLAKRSVKKRAEKYQKRAELIGRVGKKALDRVAERRGDDDEGDDG